VWEERNRAIQAVPAIGIINFAGILPLNLFLVECGAEVPVPVRDIYNLEFEIFQSWGWACFYISSVTIFVTHTCLGWAKCCSNPEFGIPKGYQNKAMHLGYIMTFFIGVVYITFPLYTHYAYMKPGQWAGQAGAEPIYAQIPTVTP